MRPLPLVLLVDDEPQILAALQRVLRTVPARIEVVTSAEAALRVIADDEPVLVLADNRMGLGMNGCELLKQIHARYPRARLILHTGDVDPATDFEVWSKPTEVSRLRAAIDALLAARAGE